MQNKPASENCRTYRHLPVRNNAAASMGLRTKSRVSVIT